MSSHTADRYIVEILLDAEHALSELIAEAVAVGDYETVDVIRRAAMDVQHIRSKFPDSAVQAKKPVPVKASVKRPDSATRGKPRRPAPPPSKAPAKPAPAAQKSKSVPKPSKDPSVGYPKFEVYGNMISRVDWIQNRGRTESKKCTKSSFDFVVMALQRLTQLRSGALRIEDITETTQQIADEGVPIPEVHTTVQMLCDHGLIAQGTGQSYYVPMNIEKIVKRAVSGR